MRDHQDQLIALGVHVYAVTFESPSHVREYRERTAINVPVLRDPRRDAYKAFGIDRNRLRTVWSLSTIWYYLRQGVRGRLPHARRSDYFQLGGDVLLSADGEVCWVYASREPADRPDIETILKVVHDCVKH